MLLEQASEWLGWPHPDSILEPKGEGAAACAHLAKLKISESLKRSFPNVSVEAGILTTDPEGVTTASPLAIVCEFASGASEEALVETHRLAWNFSKTALLITLEPHRLTAWSCFQDPSQDESKIRVCDFEHEGTFGSSATSGQTRVRELLHWVSLITGSLLRQLPEQFPHDGRADALLLKNLRHVRSELIKARLDRNFCHDLLARIIFTQFLFHRKDSNGNPFFSKTLLAKRCEGSLKRVHEDLASVLQDKEETYALFRWMDERFNGDLFPGHANQGTAEREAAWLAEKEAVNEQHLRLLAELVSGTIDTTDRQLQLWPSYSFDIIPLEFISSVYEEFLNEDRFEKKAYYTRPQLVDYVLDAVLPWRGKEWDLRILDPSCGSGIFLVKAFQRLIHRWRQANQREPLVRDLKPMLAKSFVGVDIDPDSIRVACFSLYLTMADAIDPKHYVTREKVFPRLRGARLICQDFFDETTKGIRTKEDCGSYHLVIGNAPWGDNSIKSTSNALMIEVPASGRKKAKSIERTKAALWAEEHEWPVANLDIGPLFVAKSIGLLREGGRVAMVQPAPPWLYQRAQPACDLRRKLFESFKVDEVTNLSALRREMFTDVIGPACVMVAGRGRPAPKETLYYYTPKPLRGGDGNSEFRVEPQDVNRVTQLEAANDPLIWPALAMGGRRDLQLIRKLARLPNLQTLKDDGEILTRMGVIPGDRKKALPDLKGKRYFDARNFSDNVLLELNAADAPPWDDPRVDSLHGIRGYEEFKNPQLLIKQSFVARLGRFRAALVKSDDEEWGVVCKETYLSVRDCSDDLRHIHAACVSYNSLITTYYLFLTSSRLGHFITEVPTKELMKAPLPSVVPDFKNIDSFDAVDDAMQKAVGLTAADRTIIDDFLEVSLPDAIRQSPGQAREATQREAEKKTEPELTQFLKTATRVLKSTFGKDKSVSATIYQEPAEAIGLPVRMVTIQLGGNSAGVKVERMVVEGLLDKLATFHRDVLRKNVRSGFGGGLGFQRVAFFFHGHGSGRNRVQNLTIIKPDEYRYWTRSQAMRDADDLVASMLQAARGAEDGR